MLFVILVVLLLVWAVWRTVVLVRTDGLGSRPAPRSHAEQTLGSTWPQQDDWNR
ncbi:hypothetical protein ACHAAC_16875 [Aeromicrobium sp. CF4.19]|uniref:hypothetical protein n=1 Tax=Aeromicrobium sp. CF4.19 TaxID=3373082 RepID=UPI003EE449DE